MTELAAQVLTAPFPAVLATAAEGAAEGAYASNIDVPAWAWVAFIGFIVAALVIDLKVVMREAHEVSTREAAWYSAVWIAMGVAFGGIVWWWQGGQAGTEYITGYLIEKSLSVDNVFVWAVLFTFFGVPAKYQHRTLFWGIFGALVLRAIFIFAGIALLEAIDWIVYVFGVLLLYTAYRIATSDELEIDPEHNPVLRRVRRLIPHTDGFRGERFFVRERGRLLATPLFTTLIAIELTDVLFAVDSIPAILAVTREEFLVFSSNAFAILGLRALYFLLAGMKDRFVYLDQGLGVILGFVGVKFLISDLYHIPTWASLAVIAIVLTVTIVLSLRAEKQPEALKGKQGPAGERGTKEPRVK